MFNFKGIVAGVALAAATLTATGAMAGARSLVIGAQDGGDPTAELSAVGTFDALDFLSTDTGLTFAGLSGYNSILAYSNFPPGDAVAFGNLLQQFSDAGGVVVLATYGFSNPWAFGGGIMSTGYAPLTNLGSNGDVDGTIVQVAADPIFTGVDLGAVSFFHNSNYAHPGLDTDAVLLATDGNGVNMIARNATGNVYGFNLFPASGFGTNEETYKLFANALQGGNVVNTGVPEPATWGLMILGFGAAGATLRRRRQALAA